MKQLVALLFASALLALIVIPVSRVVNSLPVNSDVRADGSGPAPPFPPTPGSPMSMLWADGSGPAPPFPPTPDPPMVGLPA